MLRGDNKKALLKIIYINWKRNIWIWRDFSLLIDGRWWTLKRWILISLPILIALLISFRMLWGSGYIGYIDGRSVSVSVFDYAIMHQAWNLLLWPILIFILSIVSSIGIYRHKVMLVSISALTFIVLSFLGIMSFGPLLLPLGIFLFIYSFRLKSIWELSCIFLWSHKLIRAC